MKEAILGLLLLILFLIGLGTIVYVELLAEYLSHSHR